MARLPRLVIPHHPHHVIQKGHDEQAIFRDEEDFLMFLSRLREAARQFDVAVHAYVLMSTHLHLLLTPHDEQGLARMMQWVGRQYVPYFNRKYQRSGSLWQGRYRATVLEADAYLLLCSRYIELNPVRSGVVVTPEQYPWSSYLHHVGARPDAWMSDHALYWELGNTPFDREAAYRQLVEQGVTQKETDMLGRAIYTAWALGSEVFKDGLERDSERRVRPGKRGRPALLERT
ncbi:transposase [Herbaspirillum sp. RTI4]|uniref:transposase n=1 Tax=Herbaspirillum sp. RTI4 TaxID=3048640 RepID=UPI002AB4CA23|nr:transposase [Herbaspirillum sp. RTI4]MDY7577843.1 transposase [Herbaspirillum sp. RTI4]MEA9982461.1 transposase [Herbaspirillum sp. RTI4]